MKIKPSSLACAFAFLTLTMLADEKVASVPESKSAENKRWAFQPPTRPAVPIVRNARWVRNPIDNFVLAKLEKENLAPAREASREILIRRLYFDLTGLPPAPQEVTQFVNDRSSDAYEKLVDRLLASPRYGERWGRHWLDVVRFAESNGFEMNQPRPNAWAYRDYVIHAFNDDIPYTRFIQEQLAGDKFGVDAATGFIVGGPWDEVKSPDPVLTAQQRADELHDMVSTTGSAFLGLTVGCARCHNHKFDPISQVDYYKLTAVFAGVKHGERPARAPDEEEREKKAGELRREQSEMELRLSHFLPLAQPSRDPSKTPIRPGVQPDYNVDHFASVNAKFVRFTVEETNDKTEPCLDELEIWSDEEKPRNVARANGTVKLSSSGDYPGAAIHKLEHLNDGLYGNSHSWISNQKGKGWVQLELPQSVLINKIIWGRDREKKYQDRLAVRYKIEVATALDSWTVVASSSDRVPFSQDTKPAPIYSADGMPDASRKELEHLLGRRKEIETMLKTFEPVQVYAGQFTEPGPTYRLSRGDPMQKNEQVPPGAISVIAPALELSTNAPEQERRLALANWITHPQNPLTARVMVNRLWHWHFNQGLVTTPSDFGANGTRPSHPELLDWLATEFVARGWSIKAMHRLILLSNTYRQSSAFNPAAQAVDASNLYLWRFSPQRLEAECIHDSILAFSGKLDLRAGGAGYDPFEANSNYVRVYNPKEKFGPEDWRRMIYQTHIRLRQDGTFGNFDCPDGGQVCPRRTSSTTPLQALNLLNSQFILQQAGLFAERLQREAGEKPAAQVRRAFELVFNRQPERDEVAGAAKLIQTSGLTAFCRAMFNANEFLYLY